MHVAFRIALLCSAALRTCGAEAPLTAADIHVRDPFVYADRATSTYYLYAQSANRTGSGFQGVEVYASTNLADWAPPRPVLTLPPEQRVSMVWAPEVHAHAGAYYLFVTLTFRDTLAEAKPVDAKRWPPLFRRGTWIFRADRPDGPFHPLASAPATPPAWMALDGTLWVEDNRPYLVFCHEWVQTVDGAVCALPLAADLSSAAGEPVPLFRASDAPGAKKGRKEGKVTDGPFLYRSSASGALFMIWSTFIPGKEYCVLLARSQSGRVAGPWTGHAPLYARNGGHGMIFCDFSGRLQLALHQPNTGPFERLHLFELADDGETLRLKGQE